MKYIKKCHFLLAVHSCIDLINIHWFFIKPRALCEFVYGVRRIDCNSHFRDAATPRNASIFTQIFCKNMKIKMLCIMHNIRDVQVSYSCCEVTISGQVLIIYITTRLMRQSHMSLSRIFSVHSSLSTKKRRRIEKSLWHDHYYEIVRNIFTCTYIWKYARFRFGASDQADKENTKIDCPSVSWTNSSLTSSIF